jgi:hypothetical protein
MPVDAVVYPVRTEGLEINVLDDGFVVYQKSHDRVHYLNPTAGLLLELCDGTLSEAELGERMAAAWNLPEPPHEEIMAGLKDLREQELVR